MLLRGRHNRPTNPSHVQNFTGAAFFWELPYFKGDNPKSGRLGSLGTSTSPDLTKGPVRKTQERAGGRGPQRQRGHRLASEPTSRDTPQGNPQACAPAHPPQGWRGANPEQPRWPPGVGQHVHATVTAHEGPEVAGSAHPAAHTQPSTHTGQDFYVKLQEHTQRILHISNGH